jgi:2-C-methyl-D-erythritol 4-phosphate cytidylyltransferase
MNVTAIIAAAGAGRRMKADRPKQLLTLDNTPILIYTIRKFDACP